MKQKQIQTALFQCFHNPVGPEDTTRLVAENSEREHNNCDKADAIVTLPGEWKSHSSYVNVNATQGD